MTNTKGSAIDINYWLIAVIAALVFIPFLGKVHLFDWDEINFAESAREMILTGDYLTVQINFIPFWEKPPLFIWMQVASMKLFGINEFAARFPNAICGIITLLFLYHTGKKMETKTFGWIWILAYAGALLPFFYFKSGIIDPWFNLFIFAGIYFFVKYLHSEGNAKKAFQAALSGLFIGLGILTKGPVAFLIFALTVIVFIIIRRFKITITLKDVLVFGLFLVATGGLWFILQIAIGNYGIIADFIEYQIRLFKTKDAGHGGFLLYHFVVLLFGVFPSSIFAFPAYRNPLSQESFQKQFHQIMLILLSVVLILFTIVKTKILHYSSLAYFPLSFFAATYIYNTIKNGNRVNRIVENAVIVLGIVFSVLVLAIPIVMIFFKTRIIESGIIRDQFALGNLQANVNWNGFEVLPGLILLAGMLLFRFYASKNTRKALLTVYVSTVLFLSLVMVMIVPNIEGYSQRAAIEFYKDRQGEDVYVQTLGFKSYAHLFYTRKEIPDNKDSYDIQWLLTGDIDKDVWFVAKIHRKERYLSEYPELEVVDIKNGFVFFKRKMEVLVYDK